MQDKVNMSVAIIPMARDFGWSPSVAGVVQSSFFWGYALSQARFHPCCHALLPPPLL